eukprot:140429-Ditylum_brightwellii.AAC.1
MNSHARPLDPQWDDPPDDDYLAPTASATRRFEAHIAKTPMANNPIFYFPPDDTSDDDPNEFSSYYLSTNSTYSSDINLLPPSTPKCQVPPEEPPLVNTVDFAPINDILADPASSSPTA